MKDNIIKPVHTSDEIKRLYYGTDPDKKPTWDNPAYRSVEIWGLILTILYFVYFIGIGLSGVAFEYIHLVQKYMGSNMIVEYINSIDTSYISTVIDSSRLIWKFMLEFMYAIVYLLIAIAPIIPIPIKVINIIYKAMYKRNVKKGLIYDSPISRRDFDYYYRLYKNAENMLSYLESAEIIDLSTNDENVVKMRIHNQMISSEKRFVFRNMVHKIFLPDIIDFSVIDKDFEETMDRRKREKKKKIFTRKSTLTEK